MIIKENQILEAEIFFNTKPESILAPYALKMNKKHKPIQYAIKALEKNGINGYIIDELMLGIIIIWYVIEIINKKSIYPIVDEDIFNAYNHFNSFLNFFNKFEDERNELKYFPYEIEIEKFISKLFKKLYINYTDIPKELILIYFSIMKCFENKLEYTRKKQ